MPAYKSQADAQRDTALAFLPTMLTCKDLQRNLYGQPSGSRDHFKDSSRKRRFNKGPSFKQNKRVKYDSQHSSTFKNAGGDNFAFGRRQSRGQRGGRGGFKKNPQ